jgi:hypothetical protein
MPPWRPLLAGPDAAPVWEAIADIAVALRPPPELGEPAGEGGADAERGEAGGAATGEAGGAASGRPDDRGLNPSVASGSAGQALFFAYLALHRAVAEQASPAGPPPLPHEVLETAEESAGRLLDRAADALAEVPTGADLYAGFAGVGWVVEHVQSRFLELAPSGSSAAEDAPPEDPNAEIDEAVLEVARQTPWQADYDLIRGLTGLGVYALERLPRPSGAACLEAVIARLAELAVPRPEGITWFTAPELMPEWQREAYPAGVYNLGVAHGMPAVIALLAAAGAAGVARSQAQPLLAGAVRWLLAHRLDAGSSSCFPYTVAADAEPQPARLAWCYGDAGVAAALLAAGEAAGEAGWRDAAAEIARAGAARTAASSGVFDSGLCHGAAGLSHLFNRMFQSTGEPALAGAARRWLQDALARREPGQGVAGWSALISDPGGERRRVAEPGFLEGAAGIGLALLAAVSPLEPGWDRLLMASVRTSY